jgi:hypothetical protein
MVGLTAPAKIRGALLRHRFREGQGDPDPNFQ